jgi:acid phosphatase
MTVSRRDLLKNSAILPAGMAVPAASAMADVVPLKFVLIGDWGRLGHDNQIDVARQMGITASEFGSVYTVSLGDNFYENGVAGVDDPQWQSSFEKIYTADSLQTPWKIILGNHDYRGNVQAQLDYGKTSPRWRLPARYYQESVTLPDGGKADFFYLDTSPFIRRYAGTKVDISGQDSQTQLEWLDAALGASTARWKIVIGHHPIYTAVTGHDHDEPDMIARLDPVLRRHNVLVYINGHDHCFQVVNQEGVAYVTNGAGSQTYTPVGKREGFCSGAHGFMTVALTSRQLDFSLIDMTGKSLYTQSIKNV